MLFCALVAPSVLFTGMLFDLQGLRDSKIPQAFLGIDPHLTVRDLLGRPVPISGDGKVRYELLA